MFGAALLLGGVLLLGLAAGLFVVLKLLGIQRIGNLDTDEAHGGEPRNYLVVGSDERDGEEGGSQRSDTVMVVRIDPGEDEAAVLSIPRDLMVPIAGTGRTDRINSAYSIGRDTLIHTIRDAFGIKLHHYVEIDFSSFEDVVDSAGGVPIWTDAALKDEGSGLYVPDLGCVELDGEQALAFVRSRHLQYMTSDGGWSEPDPTADLGRIERQQVFMRRALSEAVSQARSNPARIPDLVDTAVDAVAIDEGLSVRDLLDLAGRLRELDPDQLRTYPLPVVDRGDGATLAMDREAARPVLDYFRGSEAGTAAGDGEGETDDEAEGEAPADDSATEPGTAASDAAAAEADAAESGSAEPESTSDEPSRTDGEDAEPPPSSFDTGADEFVVGVPPEGESC